MSEDVPSYGEAQNLPEQALASTLLFAAAGKGSAAMDKFSNWLLGAYAAAVALVIGKPEGGLGIGPGLPFHTLHALLTTFFIVATIGVIAKFLSVIVASAAKGAAVGREIAEAELKKPSHVPINPIAFISIVLEAMPAPGRWIAAPMIKKLPQGNLMAAPRVFLCLAQLQGLLILAEVTLTLWMIYVIADTATF